MGRIHAQEDHTPGAPSERASSCLLLVCPQAWPGKARLGGDCRFMEYRFVDAAARDGLTAWWAEGEHGAGSACVEVVASSRALEGGFSQQSLNRLFSQQLADYRPSAVVVAGIHGCTIDLVRIADLMGIPAAFILDCAALAAIEALQPAGGDARWVADALARACALVWMDAGEPPSDRAMAWVGIEQLGETLTIAGREKNRARGFDYARYEFCLRDHPLLLQMQAADVSHFRGCERVLDLGCGAGIFLELLRRAGIEGEGVERSEAIADYARGMGLQIETGNALAWLQQAGQRYDGIYCSHFIEHLDFDQVQDLLQQITEKLRPGGVLVLAFPDPESIRSQLLGFWRDPEHVRFYHPELIATLATALGLSCEWRSYDDQPHRVVSFPLAPPPVAEAPGGVMPGPVPAGGRWIGRLLARLGLVSVSQYQELLHEVNRVVERQNRVLQQLEARTDTLWAVNQTWAWNDNALLRFRKR